MQAIISNSIECSLMDCKNVSTIIEAFTDLTPLQKAWKHFCEEKSLIDLSNYNDNIILSSIKDPNDENSIFPSRYTKGYRRIFVENYCNSECRDIILNALLKDFDFTFFNTSLLMSLYSDEDHGCMDNELLNAEQEFDNYNGDEDESDYFTAMDNAGIIKLIKYCLDNVNMNIVKLRFDAIFENNKDEHKMSKKMYERIWERAITFEEEMAEYDNFSSEDEYEDDLEIEQAETGEYLRDLGY